jgi:hypothetical protein
MVADFFLYFIAAVTTGFNSLIIECLRCRKYEYQPG